MKTLIEFEGKTVESLFLALEEKDPTFSFLHDPPGKLIGGQFLLPEGKLVRFFISKFNHVEEFDTTMSWEKELFFKEKIERIELLE